MRVFSGITSALVVSLSLFDAVSASAHVIDVSLKKRHFGRASNDAERSLALRGETALSKRFDSAKFSFYDAGLGACGKVNSGNDFVSFNQPRSLE